MDGGRLFVNKGGGADCSDSNTCICKQTPKATTTTTTTTPRVAGPYLLSSGKCPEGEFIPKSRKCKKSAGILGLGSSVSQKGFTTLPKGCVSTADGVKLSTQGEADCSEENKCICVSKGTPTPAPAAAAGPTKLDSGDCTTRIADADACKKAAADLGMTFQTFVHATRGKWPLGCWFWKNKLWFNTGDKTTGKGLADACGMKGSYCICA